MEVVTGATSSLLPKLGALLQEEYNLGEKVKRNIESLQNELLFMNAALRKVASGDHVDEQVKTWAGVIRELSYDMEDAVSAFMGGSHSQGYGPASLGSFRGLLNKAFSMCLMGKTHHRIAGMIEEVKSLTTEVALLRDRYRLGSDVGMDFRSSGITIGDDSGFDGYFITEQQEPTRRTGIMEPVRVNEDMQKLEEWMSSGKQELGVLSVFGFGGVGKTTMAMALYRQHGHLFERRAMVTVAQNSDPEVVLTSILNQVKLQASSEGQQETGGTGTKSEEDKSLLRSILSRVRLPARNEDSDVRAWEEKHKRIIEDLEKHLITKRYLLLIDDVWSSSTWQRIRKYLPKNSFCSRIIVTTRFQAVARICLVDGNSDYVHTVKVLSDRQARSLFWNSLSELGWEQNVSMPDIVGNICCGLPLAIVTMAGVVAASPYKSFEDWVGVCKNLFPGGGSVTIRHKSEECRRIIEYAYNDMPADIKTCSLYVSVFPKGSNISVKRLMRHWISEGFMTERHGVTAERVAEVYFNRLITRKIILPVEYSSNGMVKTCRVHDIFHEYITSKSDQENFVSVVDSYWSMTIRSNKIRRLSLQSIGSGHAEKADRLNMSHVRSLTMFGSLNQLRFKTLKTAIVQVLDLEGCGGFKDSHAKVIFEMILLRYLSLRRTDISSIPSKIGNLKYLETLDLRETEVQNLPKAIEQLERISNILGGNKNTRQSLKLPKDIKKGRMKTLRILSGIEITEGSTIASQLHEFTGLKKLAIYKLHRDAGIFSDLLSSIQYLGGHALEALVIDDESSEFHNTLDSMSTIPPTNLSALELSGKLRKLPEWLPSLTQLVKLTLSASVLRTDNLLLLCELSSLFSLTFSVSAANQDPGMTAILEKNRSDCGDIFVPPRGFGNLKLLRISVPLLPSIIFSEEATQGLQRLELRFNMLEGLHGMDKLTELRHVILTVDGKKGEPTKSTLEQLKESSSSSLYTLIVNE